MIWKGIEHARNRRHDSAYRAWQRVIGFLGPRWDSAKGRIVYGAFDRVEYWPLLKIFVEELLKRGVLSEDRKGTHLAHANSLRAALTQALKEAPVDGEGDLKSLLCMALGYGAQYIFEPYGSLFSVHDSVKVDEKSQMLGIGPDFPPGEVFMGPGLRFHPGEYTYEFPVFSMAKESVELSTYVVMSDTEGSISRFSRIHLLPPNSWRRVEAPFRVLRRDSAQRIDIVLSLKGKGSLTVGPLRIHRDG